MSNIFDLFKRIASSEPRQAEPVGWILVGLGNPGEKYALTRHNTGFLALDYLAQKYNVRINRSKFHALCGHVTIENQHVLLLKPQTMMNLSGNAVGEAAEFYHVPPEHILVVFDDINLDVGRIRVRDKGSDGGHNGIKSIIYRLQSDMFPRIKIGIGQKPHPDYDLADWVLSSFPKEDQHILFEAFSTVQTGVELIISGKLAEAQQICNSHRAQEDS